MFEITQLGIKMSDTAIKVEGLSKRFRLLNQGLQKKTLKNILLSPLRNFKDAASLTSGRGSSEDYFYALKNVSFEIKKGEVVGIIGKNGAGKTTLLTILSKITAPTEGRAEINGRVNSLLSVGTGFNGNLTGRENIYMNGTIHGMSRKEITSKLPEIIKFSGVEKFVDMPVKRYSSGMAVRLGFAVAAFLEPEVLIIDEVLAVGDASFQEKCISKIHDVCGQGRTVLFVSHQLNTVSSLCDRCILLESGEVIADGETHKVIDKYLTKNVTRVSEFQWPKNSNHDGICSFISARVINDKFETIASAFNHERVGIEVTYERYDPSFEPVPCIDVKNLKDQLIFMGVADSNVVKLENDKQTLVMWIPTHLLNEDKYNVDFALVSVLGWKVHFHETKVISFAIFDDVSKRTHDYTGRVDGAVLPKLEWEKV